MFVKMLSLQQYKTIRILVVNIAFLCYALWWE